MEPTALRCDRLPARSRPAGLVLLLALGLAAVPACSGGGPSDAAVADAPDADAADVPVAADPGLPDAPVPDAAPDPGPDTRDPGPCVRDCVGKACGPDGCGGSCGPCPGCDGEDTGLCFAGMCAETCCPACQDRVCGPDGCGATCGTCTGGTQCDGASGQCVPTCDWATDRPATWGPAGQVAEWACPSTPADVQATCIDFTGDHLGDSGIASQCQPLIDIVQSPDPGPLPLVIELSGVADPSNAASFLLAALPTVADTDPGAAAGDVLVQEDGYRQADCLPKVAIPGAKVEGGVLSATAATLSIPIDFSGVTVPLVLSPAIVLGQVLDGGGPDGFDLQDGVLGGVITKAAADAFVDGLQAACDAAPSGEAPAYCTYTTVLRSAIAGMYDLYSNGDGTFQTASAPDLPGDAISVCLTFRLAKARIVGFAPPP